MSTKQIDGQVELVLRPMISAGALVATCIYFYNIKCDCGKKSLQYGVYLTKNERIDFFLCTHCWTWCEINGRESRHIDNAYNKVMLDYKEQVEGHKTGFVWA
jgi:carboxypeptidase C (cathepsin A)